MIRYWPHHLEKMSDAELQLIDSLPCDHNRNIKSEDKGNRNEVGKPLAVQGYLLKFSLSSISFSSDLNDFY